MRCPLAFQFVFAPAVAGQLQFARHVQHSVSIKSFDQNETIVRFQDFGDNALTTADSPDRAIVVSGQTPSDPTPQEIMNDLSNVFATIGAIAEFFGPEGEAVAMAMNVCVKIMGIISSLLGMFTPNPVMVAIRAFEKDMMQKMTEVSDAITTAKNTAQLGAIGLILDNAEGPLKNIIGYWNNLYPNGSKDGKTPNQAALDVFKMLVNTGPISKFRDNWVLLTSCLAGTNPDCILQGRGPLDILLYDGQAYPRPRVLTESIQYYYLIAQKSAVAICAYAKYVLQDDQCHFLPELHTNFVAMTQAMHNSVKGMHAEFTSSVGANLLPKVISYWADKHPNQGQTGAAAICSAVSNEFKNFYFYSDLSKYFNAKNWAIVVMNDKEHGSGNWEAAWYTSGYHLSYAGYDIVYDFQSLPMQNYKDSDCRYSNVEDVSGEMTCINRMHGGHDWALRHGRRRYKVFFAANAVNYDYTQFESGDYRLIFPGRKVSMAQSDGLGSVISWSANSDTEINSSTFTV